MAGSKIYLCGSVKKGVEDVRPSDTFWSKEDEAAVAASFRKPILLLNPEKSPIDRSDFRLNFACDMFLVSQAGGLLVDLRRSKGIGVGAEMMLAAQLGTPIVGWLPPTSHYVREEITELAGQNLRNWTHPFVAGLCSDTSPDLMSAAKRLEALIEASVASSNSWRGPSFLIELIGEFEQRYPEFSESVRRFGE